MVRGNHVRLSAVLAVVGLSLVGLTACSATPTTGNGPTLADTKSPVQLLRNEAASRIPPAAIASVTETLDASVRCRTESEDPLGLRRSWHSDAQVTVEAAAIWRVDAIVDALAQSFVDQGWTLTPIDAGGRIHSVELSREGSTSEIRVSAHRPDAAAPLESDATDPVTIDLELHGPCVETQGAESAEVKKLEKTG
ncbi:hypothetical protein ABIE21_002229 [Conyzicola nivalis]|uniref:Uncharacterized protein n=1 Tax=Conyzicola nivalis TaxID=1477021 RepID=A0ABV2QNV6_9MICO